MPRLLLLLGIVGLAFVPLTAGAQGCDPGFIEVVGRIMDPVGSTTDGVACCDVQVSTPDGSVITRTRSDGTFRTCVPCTTPADPIRVLGAARCCTARSFRDVDGCTDPATGLPRVVDLGEFSCVAAPWPDRTALVGAVTCRSGVLLEPVAGCGIYVSEMGIFPIGFTRTDANGDWELCTDCDPTNPNPILHVEAQCCGEIQRALPDLCPERYATSTFVCDPCPVPPCPSDDEVEVTGRVACGIDADGDGEWDPMAGCSVRLSVTSTCSSPPADVIVVTDANGNYRGCIRCPATETCPTWMLTATPECCPASARTVEMNGCVRSFDMGEQVCAPAPGSDCSPAPPCPTGETIVRGRVTCPDPVTGDRRPIAGCVVLLTPVTCMASPITAITDADGNYSACVPCVGCNAVDVEAQCCGDVRRGPLQCGVESVIDVDCVSCTLAPNPCAPERTFSGQVTCIGRMGRLEPVAGCRVRLECAAGGGPSVFATTDASGEYEACFECAACAVVRISAECCPGAVRDVDAPNCSAYRVDLACGDCVPPRPCAGPESIQVSGRVHCTQGGAPTPIAGCDVRLAGLDAAGNEVTSAPTVPDASGGYVGCLGCGGGSVVAVEALATCCGERVTQPVMGCPETLAMPSIACDGCSPCPDGFTRVQGRVRCRGGGPVAGCIVRIVVPTCGGVLVVETTADDQGNYRLCVPCACDGESIRVTSLCCPATRVVTPDRCGPITPVPTLFCEFPCR